MSVVVTSNVDEWAAKLSKILDDFGFHSPSEDGPMGTAIVKKIAANISERGLSDSRGYDRDFDENKRDYRIEKLKTYGERRPNVRTSQMLSPESVEGEQEIGSDGKELTWKYGTGDTPSNARTENDRTTTDREKAGYAHDGPSGNNDRPFFGYNADDEQAARDIAEQALDRHLRQQ